MKNRDTTPQQIINVNYAGEYGAIRLYRSQIMVAKLFHKDLLGDLTHILQDEQKHCAIFRTIMPEYGLVPCRLTWIWGIAGYVLGIITALLGKRALLICVKAAENTAHTHLAAQVAFLAGKDENLAGIISSIHTEEYNHVMLSENHLGDKPLTGYENLLYRAIYSICEITMWVVTQGDSTRLKRAMGS